MNEKFVFGMLLGLAAGALITANSVKLRHMIVEKQEKVQSEVSKLKDKAVKKAKGKVE